MKGSCRDRVLKAELPTHSFTTGPCYHPGSKRARACTSPSRISFRSPPLSSLAPNLLHFPDPDKQCVRKFRFPWRIVEAQRSILPGRVGPAALPQCLNSHQGAAFRSPQIRNDGGMITRSTLGDKRPFVCNSNSLIQVHHRALGLHRRARPMKPPKSAPTTVRNKPQV